METWTDLPAGEHDPESMPAGLFKLCNRPVVGKTSIMRCNAIVKRKCLGSAWHAGDAHGHVPQNKIVWRARQSHANLPPRLLVRPYSALRPCPIARCSPHACCAAVAANLSSRVVALTCNTCKYRW
eukprot:6175362-Pleurochrysis_carterae.AAC.1